MSKTAALSVVFCAAVLLSACDGKNSAPPSSPSSSSNQDTTSHTVMWVEDTLGGELSRINSVWAFSENDVWVTGWFYIYDENNQPIHNKTCNVAHWDGKEWQLRRIMENFNGTDVFAEIQAIYAFNQTNIWIDPAVHWTGQDWHAYDLNGVVNGAIRGIWGAKQTDVYYVGENETIVHWDGHRFDELRAKTEITCRGVWGCGDTAFVAAGDNAGVTGGPGYIYRYYKGRFIDAENIILDGNPIAMWGIRGFCYSGGCSSIYRYNGVRWDRVLDHTRCCIGISGSAVNDIYTYHENGAVIHYNGSTWKCVLQPVMPGLWGTGIAVSGNFLFAVGWHLSGRDSKYYAVVYRGQRV